MKTPLFFLGVSIPTGHLPLQARSLLWVVCRIIAAQGDESHGNLVKNPTLGIYFRTPWVYQAGHSGFSAGLRSCKAALSELVFELLGMAKTT